MRGSPFDDEDGEDEPRVWIIEERPPLRDGKVFVDFDERATIGDSLEAAYVALDHAFRGIWIEKSLESGCPASIGTTETSTSWSR